MTTSRAYRSELRQAQAERTRRRVIEASAEVFAEHGYAGTTLARIAERAGVSVETVRNQGPKPSLMRAAVEYAAFGAAAGSDILDLDTSKAILALDSPDPIPALAARQQAIVNEGSAGVWTALVAGAASDPELRRYYHELVAEIGAQNRRILQVLMDRGWARPDRTLDELAESWAVISSDDTWIRIVVLDGRSREEYIAWVEDAIRSLLLR